MTYVTEDYRAELKLLHQNPHWGDEGHLWLGRVASLADRLGAASVLDYGCGKGTFAQAWGQRGHVTVREYDPAILGKDRLPYPADLVVCTDVLEHVEPFAVQGVLDHISVLARKGAFLVIACRPARAKLSDGRNAHLVVQEPAWWVRRLRKYNWNVKYVTQRKGRALIAECIK